jgi:hypothetical protein
VAAVASLWKALEQDHRDETCWGGLDLRDYIGPSNDLSCYSDRGGEYLYSEQCVRCCGIADVTGIAESSLLESDCQGSGH